MYISLDKCAIRLLYLVTALSMTRIRDDSLVMMFFTNRAIHTLILGCGSISNLKKKQIYSPDFLLDYDKGTKILACSSHGDPRRSQDNDSVEYYPHYAPKYATHISKFHIVTEKSA